MARGWTYEYLCDFVPGIPRSPSSSIDAGDLNPIIKQLLTICPDSEIFDVGGHSVILQITEHIAAKVSYRPGDTYLRQEQTIFDLLDQAPCPYIIKSFFRAPDVTFMQLLHNGTLHERMTMKAMKDKPRPVLPWMQQLSDAVACIESLGYAHGDINPRNILLDDEDQLQLADFGHALKIGDPVEVGYEPYVRFYNMITGGEYGNAGPVTEQFALGSIFWFITRGTELYADIEGPEMVNRLIYRQYPVTDPQDPIDCIISDCWQGNFRSVTDLSNRVRKVAAFEFDETFQQKKKISAQIYQMLSDPTRQEHASSRSEM